MTCDRCQGQMLRELIHRQGPWWWKCLACGERLDGTILLNRAEQDAAAAMQREADERDLREWSILFSRIPSVQSA